ncbi:MAG: glutaredoxin family protein [Pseudomonadales bacterium]
MIPKRLELMTTEGCHLCDEALAMLLAMEALAGCWLEAVDVAESDALMARYGERIPVVRVPESGAEIDWPFTQRDVLSWLEGLA